MVAVVSIAVLLIVALVAWGLHKIEVIPFWVAIVVSAVAVVATIGLAYLSMR